MLKTILLLTGISFATLALSGCSDEQDKALDAEPQWSENPYSEENAEENENPQPTEEINQQKDADDLNEPYPEDESGLDEAREQGIGQQY